MRPRRNAPLGGLRVLDLTRVIAGPVASRFLAGWGADVLRVEAPGHSDGTTLAIDVGIGKRSCGLDLRQPGDRTVFERLVAGTDVVVHGYRPGALAGLGYPDEALAALRPGLVIASLSAYGPLGPWAERRGFDSLVQMSRASPPRAPTRRASTTPSRSPASCSTTAPGTSSPPASCGPATAARRGRHVGGGRPRSPGRRRGCRSGRGSTPSPGPSPPLTTSRGGVTISPTPWGEAAPRAAARRHRRPHPALSPPPSRPIGPARLVTLPQPVSRLLMVV